MKPGDKVYCYNDCKVNDHDHSTFWYGFYYKIFLINGSKIWVSKNEKIDVLFSKKEFDKHFMTDSQVRKNKLLKIDESGR